MIVFDRNYNGQSISSDKTSISSDITKMIKANYPDVKVIGIIAPTGWDMIQAWHACLDAGRVPIILHYPTPKLSRIYWEAEISAAIVSSHIDLLICDRDTSIPSATACPVIVSSACETTPSLCPLRLPTSGSIIQMSSGTTGHRKGIEFRFDDIVRHLDDYNKFLRLTPGDCVVSWLPLYHDMGFVAAYIMPRLIGCKLVLIDPIRWVQRPEMLFEAIEQYGGTVCYMPNFGFEVMASRQRECTGVRHWISCSEPTRASTMNRFSEAVVVDPATLVNCWGMAENIFAVSASRGIQTRSIEGTDVVGCGAPISGVAVKEVDGELFVKSPYSIRSYIGSDLTLDDDGYYPTGDLGRIIDGQIYLVGRKHDLINVAGRKTLASDVDFAAAQEVPESAGRIATFSFQDAAAGTDVPVILVEHPDFWMKNKDHELQRRVSGRSGIEGARVHFVPPRFITKTSSGKVNRKATSRNWAVRAEEEAARRLKEHAIDEGSVWTEIQALFPWIDPTVPIKGQVDSLGFVNLSIIFARSGVTANLKPNDTIAELLVSKETSSSGLETLKIVSLTDTNVFKALGGDVIEAFDDPNGRSVQFTHVCAPPPDVLLNDLIFYDYFLSRDPRGAAAVPGFAGAIEDIKKASIIVIDEAGTIVFPFGENQMVYPQLSHDYQEKIAVDTIALRWARYSEDYFLLPRNSKRYEPDERSSVNEHIKRLSLYLGIPIIKVAYGTLDHAVTGDWPVQGRAPDARTSVYYGSSAGLELEPFKRELALALQEAAELAPTRLDADGCYVNWNDQPHWCSWHINPAMIEYIFDHYSDCVVLGKPSSSPIIAKIASRRGIRLRYRYDLSVPDDCDCVIMSGPWGQPKTNKPIFQLMAAGFGDGPTLNVSDDIAARCPPSRIL